MSSKQDVLTYVTDPQMRALSKIGEEWTTAAKIGEYLSTMWVLYEKELIELKMTKCKVLWRKRIL